MMLRQGHLEVLDQVIQGRRDPKIVDKTGYDRKIEGFKDELTKQARAKINAAKGFSPNEPALGMSDPFGPLERRDVDKIAGDAGRAPAVSEKQ